MNCESCLPVHLVSRRAKTAPRPRSDASATLPQTSVTGLCSRNLEKSTLMLMPPVVYASISPAISGPLVCARDANRRKRTQLIDHLSYPCRCADRPDASNLWREKSRTCWARFKRRLTSQTMGATNPQIVRMATLSTGDSLRWTRLQCFSNHSASPCSHIFPLSFSLRK